MRYDECRACEYMHIVDNRPFCLWHWLTGANMRQRRSVLIYMIKECPKEKKK